jgi:hypothetical protein
LDTFDATAARYREDAADAIVPRMDQNGIKFTCL